MKLKLSSLRQLIREEVEQTLDEAESKGPKAPKSFDEFRKVLASALKKAGAPEELIDELDDVSYSGGDVVNACFEAWQNIESEMKDETFRWPQDAEFYVHDCVLDMVDGFDNPMNYAPGDRRPTVNAEQLAVGTVDAMNPPEKSTKDKKSREVRDMSMLVSDILDQAAKMGYISDVLWDRGMTKIPYHVKRSDYLEKIDRIATTAAGLKPVGDDEDDLGKYVDDLTGLTVVFGNGAATIQ